MSNFEFDKDRNDRAKDLYQTYVSDYNSKLKFKDEKAETRGMSILDICPYTGVFHRRTSERSVFSTILIYNNFLATPFTVQLYYGIDAKMKL